jgi:hypothetical protein
VNSSRADKLEHSSNNDDVIESLLGQSAHDVVSRADSLLYCEAETGPSISPLVDHSTLQPVETSPFEQMPYARQLEDLYVSVISFLIFVTF